MRKQIHQHLDESIDAARAAGMTYGKYVASQSKPVIVVIPKHLKDAPTMFERLAGATPPPAPKYEHVRKAERRPMEGIRPELPPRPNVDPNHTMAQGVTDAPWLRPKRRAAKLSINRLADICKISYKTLWRWEDSGRIPTVFVEYVSEVLDAYINFGKGRNDNE